MLGNIRLRDYQKEGLRACDHAWVSGNPHIVVPMAIGTGKTDLGLSLLEMQGHRAARSGAPFRPLWLAHREELIQQPHERVLGRPMYGALAESVGIVRAEQDEADARMVIATVQTLTKRSRLERVLEAGPVTHVVVDEAHHSNAQTYRAILDVLKQANPDLRSIGLTATPKGGSGRRRGGLTEVFPFSPFSYGLQEAMDDGVLCGFTVLGIDLGVSFADVSVKAGDYDDEESGAILASENVLQYIVDTWKRRAQGRRTLAFVPSVRMVLALQKHFRRNGVKADFVTGESPRHERVDTLEEFRRGELPVLINCFVFAEGTDLPMASCLLQARPTRLDTTYMQILGRVLRICPGKDHALVLDFVPQDARDLVTAGTLLAGEDILPSAVSKDKKEMGYGLDDEAVKRRGLRPIRDIDPKRVCARVMDYTSSDAKAWHYDGNLATTSIAGDISLTIVQARGEWYLFVVPKRGHPEAIGRSRDLRDVMSRATKFGPNALSSKSAEWRQRPVSEGQRRYMHILGIARRGRNQGEAAALITHERCRRAMLKLNPATFDHEKVPRLMLGESKPSKVIARTKDEVTRRIEAMLGTEDDV